MKHRFGGSDRLRDLLAPYHGSLPRRSDGQLLPEQPTAGTRSRDDDTAAA